MTVLQSLPFIDGVVLVSPQDSILFWSRSAEALFGYSSDEILGHDVRELFGEWPVKSPIVEARRKDKSSFLAEVTCEVAEVASVVTVRDIWGDEVLETIDELEHVGAYERDLTSGATRWSSDLDIHDEDRSRVIALVEESIRRRAPLPVRYRTLLATGRLVADDNGRALRIYGSVREASEDFAEKTHELNNVMMGIVTFIEILKRHREGPAVDRALQGIEKAVKRGRAILDRK